MGVNQLASALNITSDTVRYYTRIGYLEPKRNLNNGYKEYQAGDVSRLKFIVSARKLAISVDEIGQILSEPETGESACDLIRKILNRRYDEIDKRLEETSALRDRICTIQSQFEKSTASRAKQDNIYTLISELGELV